MAAPQQRGLRRRIADWFINTGWKRLAIWLIIIVFLPIVVDVLYIYKFGPEVFTGVLIAVVTIAPFLYRRIVDVPILRIEVPGITGGRKPTLNTMNPPLLCICSLNQQRFTKLLPEVHQLPIYQDIGYLSLGLGTRAWLQLRSAFSRLRLLGGPLIVLPTATPSDEYVDWQDVTWADGLPSIMTRPNDVRYANIAIMPLNANKQACLPIPWQCDNKVNPCGPIIAWIAKRDIFMLGCTARLQDGLVPGEYRIDAQVTCRNGQKTLKGLRLRVSADWTTDISQ